MGSCASSRRRSDSGGVKVGPPPLGSKTNSIVIPSPVKDDVDRPIPDAGGLKSQWPSTRSVSTTYRDFGSKEEVFFDSRTWMDSDCDDEFLSVTGDFTPSRGSTPVHPSICVGNSQVSKAPSEDKASCHIATPSPNDKKKKLADLFRDEWALEHDAQDHSSSQTTGGGKNMVQENLSGPGFKSLGDAPNVTQLNSAPHSVGTSNGHMKPTKERPVLLTWCCLSNLASDSSNG